MDRNGDAEGNYTLLGRKPHDRKPEEYGLYPVGIFELGEDGAGLPVSICVNL